VNLARLRRPVTAGVLGLLVVGLGHLYLRRYRRGGAWMLLAIATGVLWVEDAAIDALLNGTADLATLAPLYLLVVVATVDAVSVAYRSQQYLTITDEGDLLTCPVCGNDVDPELEFCHWCTTDLDQFTVVPAGERPPADPERSDDEG